MQQQGWIKLHRKFTDWEWYSDSNCVRVFLHCLLKANHKDKQWRGETVKRGEFLTGIELFSKEVSLSVQQVRTAFKKLESTGEINKRSTSKGSRIIVCNYNTYQDEIEPEQQKNNKRVTNQQQTNNKRVTTNKNDNNVKNEKNDTHTAEISDFNVGEIKLIKGKYYERQDSGRLSEIIPNQIRPGMIPDREEFNEYCQLLRYTPEFIEMLYNHLTAKGWSINSEVIQNWKAYVRSKADWNTDYNLKIKKQRQQHEQLNTDGDLSTEEFLEELHRLEQLNEI
jgi:hypothetical protein